MSSGKLASVIPEKIEADVIRFLEPCQYLIPFLLRAGSHFRENQIGDRLNAITGPARDQRIEIGMKLRAGNQPCRDREQHEVHEEPEEDFCVQREGDFHERSNEVLVTNDEGMTKPKAPNRAQALVPTTDTRLACLSPPIVWEFFIVNIAATPGRDRRACSRPSAQSG